MNDFPFSTKKMSGSGALFDIEKLRDVSKNVISRMDADTVYSYIADWSAANDPAFHALLTRDPARSKAYLAIGRGGKSRARTRRFGRMPRAIWTLCLTSCSGRTTLCPSACLRRMPGSS